MRLATSQPSPSGARMRVMCAFQARDAANEDDLHFLSSTTLEMNLRQVGA